MKTDALRQRYLDFFRSKAHQVFPSDSLVPTDDASLLFTGAGMNQFKPYFLGLKKDVKRAVSCQKCLRTADLERVGKTTTHHTFFEMLGNFSFGDYFKEEAIAWGWEFVTKELGLSQDKLWVSVFEEDNEAFNIWKTKIGLPDPKIIRMGAVDNFWPFNAKADGPNGPCGPCSEIYIGETPGKGVEIWNLVFTQFDRQSDGSLKPLPQKNIDTGMGLERTAAVLQGVESNFEIDTFREFRRELKKLLKNDKKTPEHENAAMDHARAVVFCIADGVGPSNEGRGYVVRKLIRLGCDHLTSAGANPGQFKNTVGMVARMMGDAYPEIVKKQEEISRTIEREENSLMEIIRSQVPNCEKEMDRYLSRGVVPSGKQRLRSMAEIMFKYYDTHGVPKDLVIDLLRRRVPEGIMFNKGLEEFDKLIQQQKNRSRERSKISSEIFKKNDLYELTEGLPPTEFFGYAGCEGSGKLLRVIGENLWAFDRTPFYAEAGGQIGDTGRIFGPGLEVEVLDTQAHEKIVLHKVAVKKGRPEVGKTYELKVDTERRTDIMKNHTATHLLHSALRKVLGDQVKQSGSLVAPDRLRFDFTYFGAVSADKLREVEDLVNYEIKKNIRLDKKVMSKEEALKAGAIAFFGEKYGDRVRVVSAGDFSKELCGGTHLEFTGEIGFFKIISESSIQAGVRRLEAVTGRGASKLLEAAQKELEDLSASFGAAKESLLSRLRELAQNVERSRSVLLGAALKKLRASAERSLSKSPEVNGVKFFVWKERHANPELFQKTFDHLKGLGVPFAALWECETGGKVSLVVGCSRGIAQKGFHAGKIVKEISSLVEGSGGGRPEFAVGGGKNVAKIGEALALGEKIIRQNL